MSDEYTTYDDLDENDESIIDGDSREVIRADLAPRRAADRVGGNRAQKREKAKKSKKAQQGARRREAEGVDYVAVDFRGDTYWVPSDPSDWPVDALLAFEDGKAVTALRDLLTADENGRGGFDDLRKRKYRIKDLTELYETVARVGGFESSGN